MSKKNAQQIQTDSGKILVQNPGAFTKNNYLINLILFCLAILIGILIQHYSHILSTQQQQHQQESHEPNGEHPNNQIRPPRSTEHPAPFDMEAVYREMSEKLKKEILESISQQSVGNPNNKPNENEKKEDKIVVDNEPVREESSEIRFVANNNEPIVIDSKQIIKNQESKKNEEKIKLSEAEAAEKRERKRREDQQASKLKESKAAQQDKMESSKKEETMLKTNKENREDQLPDEVKNFKSKKISEIKPKKMWIPIPNSNGGHRRVPASEIKPGKEHSSSVKIWLYEEFLSPEECDSLIRAHETHLAETLKQKPIICFDSIETLRKNLNELKRENLAAKVTPLDFTQGTMCLNQTFSRQLEKWGLKWSYSTAFYPGESKFATIFGKRIEEATQLNETHGGKFQITSYPFQVGYKEHTDCVIDSDDQRDRYATFLVYLNDMGADGGGKTVFSELGIDVKPRQGRALTWNNMNYATGKCEPKSTHSATKVDHPTKKKIILQRWYYLKNFYALGKRTAEAALPERPPNTPKVSCDDYDHGSCRLYDEWNPDHMIEYKTRSKKF